jgi:predicted ester cyclase
VNGSQAMLAIADWLLAQFPNLLMTVEAMIAKENNLAIRLPFEGTNLGALNGLIPSTGKHFAAYERHWFQVAEKKLVEHRAAREDLPTTLQLEVLRPPGAPPS